MNRRRLLAILAPICIAVVVVVALLGVPISLPKAPVLHRSLVHTVLFRFKADAPPQDVKAACARFYSLRSQCLHPTTNEKYIHSIKGGKDNSPEGMQHGVTHGFVVEFASSEDRDYYVKKDPAHQAFVKSIERLVDETIVVDFTNGAW